MIKFLFVGRRAAGLTRAAAQAHLRDVHGRMVVCPPADAGAMPAYYAQNHVIDGAYPAGSGPHAIERDLVTHLEFESLDAMRAAVETPYYRDRLKPDEPRFVDDATVVRLNVKPRIVVDGARTPHKLFVLVSRAPGSDDATWASAGTTMLAAMAGWHAVTTLIDNAVLPSPSGSGFVDHVYEAWLETADAARIAGATAPALFAAAAVDDGRSLVIVAEEFTKARLRSIFGG